jgi:haloacetate dehalogenase
VALVFLCKKRKGRGSIHANPDLWYPAEAPIGAETKRDYLTATRNPEMVRRMLADYRGGLEFDYDDDKRDKDATRRLKCRLGLLWSRVDDMENLYSDPANPWSEWSDRIVLRRDIQSGRHMAEEA